jgi:hypothetical protein
VHESEMMPHLIRVVVLDAFTNELNYNNDIIERDAVRSIETSSS